MTQDPVAPVILKVYLMIKLNSKSCSTSKRVAPAVLMLKVILNNVEYLSSRIPRLKVVLNSVIA